MDTRLRVLALLMAACFIALFVQLNNLQVRQAASLQYKSANIYDDVAPNVMDLPRGDIVSADGVVVAKSVPTNDGYGYQRVYPTGKLFADITGYFDVVDGSIQYGVESVYNNYLISHESSAGTLNQLLTQQSGTDTVTLTVNSKLQEVARTALAGRVGAVVAINPVNGDILALYANPTYNPNLLAGHNAAQVNKVATVLEDNSNPSASPLVDGATQLTYPPGSTFKIVTTSAIYDHDPSLAHRTYPYLPYLNLPDSNVPLHNFDNEVCGGNLANALAVSCDTTYGQIGIDLGGQRLAEQASAFGFNKVPPIDLPGAVAAQFPPASSISVPFLAYSAIGQGNVRETALEDALVVSAIADGGQIMAPHVLGHVVGPQGQIIYSYKPHVWLKATTPSTAAAVRELMLGVAAQSTGTAYGLFPSGLQVAAKTGTSQNGTNACIDDWLVATAPAGNKEVPKVAVAAVVSGASAGVVCDGTGAAVAGPVVSKVLVSALGLGL